LARSFFAHRNRIDMRFADRLLTGSTVAAMAASSAGIAQPPAALLFTFYLVADGKVAQMRLTPQ
jgi:hypothetical protein